MTTIIAARGLVKRFGDLIAVDGIDFFVREGECFGVLGPNGAGKTSTIRMLSCVSPISAGDLTIDGLDVTTDSRRIKALLGVVPQEENLDPDLTVRQNLLVYARYFDIPNATARARADEVLELFQLTDKRDEVVNNLSGGMKRRLIIARALVNEPRVMVLDEPTTGLDPAARHLVWRKLRVLLQQGITMLLSTHYMEEAAHLCDRLVVMHLGKILAEGSPADLIERHVGQQVLELRLSDGQRSDAVALLSRDDRVRVEEVEDVLYGFSPRKRWGDILESLRPFGEGVRLREGTLEDVFLQLTGRGLYE
jgi:lipooligosaccharide transport system ATP-binding protein